MTIVVKMITNNADNTNLHVIIEVARKDVGSMLDLRAVGYHFSAAIGGSIVFLIGTCHIKRYERMND